MAKDKYVVLRWQMIQGPMSSYALFTWGIRLGEVQKWIADEHYKCD